MAYQFTPDDVAFLISTTGDEALANAQNLPLDGASLIGDLTRLRRTAGQFASAVAETVRLRRAAARRWGGVRAADPAARRTVGPVAGPSAPVSGAPAGAGGARLHQVLPAATFESWLLTDQALQQAPPPAVAAHRAARIARWVADHGSGVHDVTCSVAADLAATQLAGIFAVGSDLDPVRLVMARHNLARTGLPARLVRADARTAVTRGLLRYADPARRDVTGRRITSADTIPSVGELDDAEPAHLAVLRLPPGIDYRALGRPGEIEIVSWNGRVREAVAWPPELATVARRATVLAGDAIVEQFTDEEPDDVPVTAHGAYLVDPDPAVVRAHLVRQYAARHDLTLLDPHLAYLTGPTAPPGVRSFEIVEAARYSESTVRGWVRRDRVGTLEIKQRGTPVIPDELRRRLRPSGARSVARTLVIARIGQAAHAFWCRARPAGDAPGPTAYGR